MIAAVLQLAKRLSPAELALVAVVCTAVYGTATPALAQPPPAAPVTSPNNGASIKPNGSASVKPSGGSSDSPAAPQASGGSTGGASNTGNGSTNKNDQSNANQHTGNAGSSDKTQALEPWWARLGWVALVLVVGGALVAVLRYLSNRSQTDDHARGVIAALIALYLLGMLSTLFVAPDAWLILVLVAFCVSLISGGIGFLFGLPQTTRETVTTQTDGTNGSANKTAIISTAQTPQAQGGLRPSTNLETVADSLTKYVAGGALVSLGASAAYVDAFGKWVAQAVPSAPAAVGVLGGVFLIGYGSLGFLIGYIVTRTELSESFNLADAKLLHQATQCIDAVLPDTPEKATKEEQGIAASIVRQFSFASLRSEQERLTWARAQAILNHKEEARNAYAALYGSNPKNPDIVIEYATACYNDDKFDDCRFILALLEDASNLPDAKNDAERKKRIAALKAVTYLYVKGGYVDAIETVNDFLDTGLTPAKTLRFYRACGFAQMYRARKSAGKLTVGDSDDQAITDRITMDTAVTTGFGPDYKALFTQCVVPPDDSPKEDDFQAFTADHPDYAKMLGVPKPPYPTNADPPLVDPLPGNKTPAQLAQESPP